MDLATGTKHKFCDMRAHDLLDALAVQDETTCMGMTCAERVQMAVDEAYSSFISQKVKSLTKKANIRYPEANVRSIDFYEKRRLNKILITELASCGFTERGHNIILQGLTGTEKNILCFCTCKRSVQKKRSLALHSHS